MGELLYFMGYANMEGVDDHEKGETAFFNYEEHTEGAKAKYNGFQRLNEESLKEVLAQPKVIKKYDINKGSDTFDLFNPEMLRRVQEPGLDWAAKQLAKGNDLSSRPIQTDTAKEEDQVQKEEDQPSEA